MDEKTLIRMLPPGMSKPEAVQLIMRFRELDVDGSGELGFEEVLRLLMEFFRDKMEESNIRRLAQMQFQVADADKSGTLSAKEFLHIYNFVRKEAPRKNLNNSSQNAERDSESGSFLRRQSSMSGSAGLSRTNSGSGSSLLGTPSPDTKSSGT